MTQYLDYKLIVQLLETDTHKPQGDAIPLKVTGNFSDVAVRPVIEDIVKQEATKQIKGRVTSELQKRLGDETGKAVGDAVNNFIQQFGQ